MIKLLNDLKLKFSPASLSVCTRQYLINKKCGRELALAGSYTSCYFIKMVKSKTKIEKQSWKKGNPILVETIRAAKKTGNKDWLQVAGILSGPRRIRIEANLNEIEAVTAEGDSVVVPGKVLSQGEISKKIAVAALSFSEKAREKLLKTKSHAVSILDEIKKNPHAKGLKFLGAKRKNENN